MVDRVVLPYSLGAYLAVNAISDVRLVVDGPTCAFYRTDVIQGNHDLHADLLDVTGTHRVLNTFAEPDNVVMERGEVLRELLQTSVADAAYVATFVLALPMSYLTGVPYEKLIHEAVGREAPVHLLPRESLRADWLQGYADTLTAIARALPPTTGRLDSKKTAIIGHLMDRNEQDQVGNVEELERLVRLAGLEPVSTWLSGRSYEHLKEAAGAGTVVSLPHARQAARIVAENNGARLVELDLPVGLDASAGWLEALGAQGAVANEMARATALMENAVQHGLQGSRFVVAAEPHVGRGLEAFLRQLGGDVLARYETANGGTVQDDISDDLLRFQEEAPVDLFIGTAFQIGVAKAHDVPFWEFGFPSHTEHALRPKPYLGFEGALNLTEQIYNRIQLFRYLNA